MGLLAHRRRLVAGGRCDRRRDDPTEGLAILLNDDDGSYRVASGIDFGTRVLEMAGAQNVFADLTERRHVAVSKEELIARDPDVILTSTCCESWTNRRPSSTSPTSSTCSSCCAGSTSNTAEPW